MQSKGVNMERLQYEIPKMEVIFFETEDVITTSAPESDGISFME